MPVLLLLGGLAIFLARRSEAAAVHRLTSWAQIGYGLGKICLLAIPLQEPIDLVQNAEPAAISSKAVWLVCIIRTLQLFLLTTGTFDIITSARALLGLCTQEMHHAPARSSSFQSLWSRWLPSFQTSRFASPWQSLPCLLLIATLSLLARASWAGAGVWILIQALFLYLESLRGKSLWAPLPLPIQVACNLVVQVVSQVLLISPTWDTVVFHGNLMFQTSAPSLYSLFLDKRLTTPWLQTHVALAMISVLALPRLNSLLALPLKTWKVTGIIIAGLSFFLSFRQTEVVPDALRQLAQWPVSYFWEEGNARVHQGYEGWLFDKKELNVRTQQRPSPRLGDQLPDWVETQEKAGTQVIVIPLPAKLAMHPEQFLRAEYFTPAQPLSLKPKLDQLTQAGATVLDPAKLLWDRKSKRPSYYASDSHWTFETMKEVASMLAKHLRQHHAELCGQDTPLISATILERETTGDLAHALLPLNPSSLFPPETAQLVSIKGLMPDARSPVLVAGGKALEVFENAELSFGNDAGEPQHSGFATQLAVLMGRSVSVASETDLDSLQKKALGKKLLILLIEADDL